MKNGTVIFSLALLIAANNVLADNKAAAKAETATKTDAPAPITTKAIDAKSTGKVVEVESAQQLTDLLNRSDRPYTFIKFYAPWCGHCKKIGPEFETLAQKYDDLLCLAVDATKVNDFNGKYQVRGFPMFSGFKPGSSDIDERVDGADKGKLTKKMGKHSKHKLTIDERLDLIEAEVEMLSMRLDQIGQALNQLFQQVKPLIDAAAATKGNDPATKATADAQAANDVEENIVELTSPEQLAKMAETDHVILKFYAPWCGACKALKPQFAELAKKYGKQVKFAKANVDTQRALAEKHGIKSMPTTVILERGKTEPVKLIGADKREEIENHAKRLAGNK
ncbi:MAG TPA: thioredoxin domain-containing protein [Candidatus Babeliales bacterium]|nr:thioredoxin domain-containing protein [Candidatus Babeliales bacterium]